ncbi:MAG: tetratricopeptide repeat protein [Planctomycetota bacterium]|jgi:tetratricopeptide (TPR) repeat protein
MPEADLLEKTSSCTETHKEYLLGSIKSFFQAARDVRRGVCLLHAGEYDNAAEAFSRAARGGSTDETLASYLAACLIGQGKAGAAAKYFSKAAEDGAGPPAARIRHGMALWLSGKRDEAVAALREAIRDDPECAELHFQLGTLLTSLEQYEEAELRFTQALSIDRNHTEALVSLALCCGLRDAPGESVRHLQTAQTRRPHDARIGLLLAQAAKAMRQKGHAQRVQADLPETERLSDEKGIAELSLVIETEPDFVDAFLSIPVGEVDERVFAMLLETLQAALERQPEHAELRYHCGRVLERLGRQQDAIDETERALQLDPRFTRALIELGRLYQQTDRQADAAMRLEQAVEAGAEYADVFYLLGNLYRARGEVGRARTAYRRALLINERYEAALQALASLPAQ